MGGGYSGYPKYFAKPNRGNVQGFRCSLLANIQGIHRTGFSLGQTSNFGPQADSVRRRHDLAAAAGLAEFADLE